MAGMVAPPVGARVEIQMVVIFPFADTVAPPVGARVEILSPKNSLAGDSRRPSRGGASRNTPQPLTVCLGLRVAPPVGARVEIAVRP